MSYVEQGTKRAVATHALDIERWHERNDANAIKIEGYWGDWGFPVGTSWVAVDILPTQGITCLTIAHEFSVARAVGPPPPRALEWLEFEVDGVEPLKQLRDRLDEAIRKLEAQP